MDDLQRKLDELTKKNKELTEQNDELRRQSRRTSFLNENKDRLASRIFEHVPIDTKNTDEAWAKSKAQMHGMMKNMKGKEHYKIQSFVRYTVKSNNASKPRVIDMRDTKVDAKPMEFTTPITNADMERIFDHMKMKLQLQAHGSDFSVNTIEGIYLYLFKYKPTSGKGHASNDLSIPKSAYTDILNTDDNCFIWCLKAHISKTNKHTLAPDDLHDITLPYDLTNVNIPPTTDDLYTFVNNNKDVSLTIITYDNNIPELTTHISNNINANDYIDLILHNDHYMYIRKLHILLNKKHKYICRNCMHATYKEQHEYLHHTMYCYNNAPVMLTTYKEPTKVTPKPCKQVMHIAVADFECYIQDSQHIPVSFGINIIDVQGKPYIVNTHYIAGDNLLDNVYALLKTIAFDISEVINKKITMPIYMHHAKKYDMYFIQKMIADNANHELARPSYMMISSTRAQTIEVNIKNICLSFRDSALLLSSSLDKLASQLTTEDKPFTNAYLSKHKITQASKLPFPYTWFDNIDKLTDITLPDKDKWYNDMTGEHITNEQWITAINIFNMSCTRFADYLIIYMMVDIMLLSDILCSIHTRLTNDFDASPFSYLSIYSYTYNTWLSSSNHDIYITDDINVHLLCEDGMRGGFTNVATSHSKVTDNTHIIEIDETSQYGNAMCYPLPDGQTFNWLSPSDYPTYTYIYNYDINSTTGYILTVDIHIPAHLHKYVEDFPIPQHKRQVHASDLSQYQREQLPTFTKSSPLLIGDLCNKQHYTLHIAYLSTLLKYGVILTNIHMCLQCSQAPILNKYINKLVRLRDKSTCDLYRSLYKQMINGCFGKLIENIRNHLSSQVTKYAMHTLMNEQSKPTFAMRIDINNTWSLILKNKSKILLKNLTYIGTTILDYAKISMTNMWYGRLLPTFGRNNIRLLYTDTDSFIFKVKTNSLVDRLTELRDILDTSKLSEDHPCHTLTNKGKLGTFKIETIDITEYTGIKPKYIFYTTACTAKAHITLEPKHNHITHSLIHDNKILNLHRVNIKYNSQSNAMYTIHDNKKVNTIDIKNICLPDTSIRKPFKTNTSDTHVNRYGLTTQSTNHTMAYTHDVNQLSNAVIYYESITRANIIKKEIYIRKELCTPS